MSSCTTENVGRLVTPAKKLEDTIRLAELVIEVLQQNEEHHAEVSSEVVSPRSPAGSGGLLGAFSICVVSSNWCGVIFLKSQKYSEIMVLEFNEGKVQFRKIAFAEGRG